MIFLYDSVGVRYDSHEEVFRCGVVIWDGDFSEDVWWYATEDEGCEFSLLLHVDLVFDWFYRGCWIGRKVGSGLKSLSVVSDGKKPWRVVGRVKLWKGWVAGEIDGFYAVV